MGNILNVELVVPSPIPAAIGGDNIPLACTWLQVVDSKECAAVRPSLCVIERCLAWGTLVNPFPLLKSERLVEWCRDVNVEIQMKLSSRRGQDL